MTVLEEIFAWSKDRPSWQRDALRRLVQNDGDLADRDIDALTEIAKAAHGLAEGQEFVPLAKEHLPDKQSGSEPVSLMSIFHHRGVNALAENQTLRFGSKLTVVYGDNGAGKTGYIRILKGACRARGQEKILGNVVSGSTPFTPVVTIKFQVGADAQPRDWAGGSQDPLISRVSVFDTQSSAVYLSEKTDVAFRPFGLDLFDKLVRACKSVKVKLEIEQRALASSRLGDLIAQIPDGTAVHRLVANITSLTKIDDVKKLADLSPEEEKRLELVEKSLADLDAHDPAKLIQQLTLRATRVRTLARHLKAIEDALSPTTVTTVFVCGVDTRRKSEEAARLRGATFPSGLLRGTGAESWTALWEAARRFSTATAYHGHEFPFVEAGARCVLCQQELANGAVDRLRRFEAFVISTTERELQELRTRFAGFRDGLLNLKARTEMVDSVLAEIGVENEAVAERIAQGIAANEFRQKAIAATLQQDAELPVDCPAGASISGEAEEVAAQIEARAKTLSTDANPETRKRLAAEARELRARTALSKHLPLVLEEIERKKKLAAYGLCLADTATNAITQKSTAVTKSAVSQRLKDRFKAELASLTFRHVEVELKEAGGADGVLYHKLILTRAPGVDLPKVVSEGEQRCLSIGAFFAELSTADDRSGIVFDDPVSSLDYRWREAVARRLVEEAKVRQVVVFTHDVVFLLALKQIAEEQGVDQLDQHIRQLVQGSGVCAEELPWVALKVSKRIGYLKKLHQEAEALQKGGNQAAYEHQASTIYGLLREAWERGLEEVLLGGVVERYRPGVQTQQITEIADITPADCKAVEIAMTKCSRWLPGHDQAAAARAPMPEPTELKADIDALEAWVASIRKRRQ